MLRIAQNQYKPLSDDMTQRCLDLFRPVIPMSAKNAFVVKDPEDPYYGCTIPMRFEDLGARRRAALRLLPNIEDPENKSKIVISRYKSSRKYKFEADYTRATLDGGYRLCRCSRSLHKKGKYFWEFKFYSAEQKDSHVRLGIATTNADMEAPVGVDEEGYCVRDIGGAFHESKQLKPNQYTHGTRPFKGFSVGDCVGFGFTRTKEKETTTLEVWVNGVYQGVIFTNIEPKKDWIPSFSCFCGATVEARFDNFAFDQGPSWMPVAQMQPEKTKKLYTLSQMLDVMRNGTKVLRTKEMFAATDAVLTPIQDMPI